MRSVSRGPCRNTLFCLAASSLSRSGVSNADNAFTYALDKSVSSGDAAWREVTGGAVEKAPQRNERWSQLPLEAQSRSLRGAKTAPGGLVLLLKDK